MSPENWKRVKRHLQSLILYTLFHYFLCSAYTQSLFESFRARTSTVEASRNAQLGCHGILFCYCRTWTNCYTYLRRIHAVTDWGWITTRPIRTVLAILHATRGAGTNIKVGGGAHVRRKHRIFLFGSTSTISPNRFGERFRDGQSSLLSLFFAVRLLTVPPRAQPFVKVGDVPSRAPWRHCACALFVCECEHAWVIDRFAFTLCNLICSELPYVELLLWRKLGVKSGVLIHMALMRSGG